MINCQPTESHILFCGEEDDLSFDIVDVFYTIQGEGLYSGTPAMFLRLAGCNLMCPKCDTDYTSNRKMMAVEDIIANLRITFEYYHEQYYHGCKPIDGPDLVVLTGGEPFRQPIAPLLKCLAQHYPIVQIETNGCYYDENTPFDDIDICISPKTPKISHELEEHASWYKYVIRYADIDSKDGLPTCTLGYHHPVARPNKQFPREKIFISPLDEEDPTLNKLNVEAAIYSCMKFGYRMSIQQHKIVGLP